VIGLLRSSEFFIAGFYVH